MSAGVGAERRKELLERDADVALRPDTGPGGEEDAVWPVATRLIARLDRAQRLAAREVHEAHRDVDVRVGHLEEQIRSLGAVRPRPDLVTLPNPTNRRAIPHRIVDLREALADGRDGLAARGPGQVVTQSDRGGELGGVG